MSRNPRLVRTRRAQHPRWWTVVVLVLASITLITLSERGALSGTIAGAKRVAHDAVSPVQRGVAGGLRPIGDFLGGIVHYGALQHENAVLRHRLQQLEGRQLQKTGVDNALHQLAALQHEAGLPSLTGIRSVTAQVTAVDTSNFSATIDLSKGTSSGIDVGMPVVGGTGLVGLVTLAWRSGATVRLVTDASSAVSVAYGSGASAGTASVAGGGPGQLLTVNLVPPGTALRRGSVLTTSGLQHGRFPPGLPVATVVSSSSTPSSTQEHVSARPAVDMAGLEYVDVMQWQPPPLPAGAP